MASARWFFFNLILLLAISSGVNGSDTPPPILTDDSMLQLKERPLPPRSNECQFCHTQKSNFFVKKNRPLKLEHVGISPTHGNRTMSCNMCHDTNNHNYLLSSKSHPANFKQPSAVCARCHQNRYDDWSRGLHGKRMGGWRQPKVQFNCIDCHSPHSVKFPPMQASENPIQSPYVIPKIRSESH